jgi:hypothetical protein
VSRRTSRALRLFSNPLNASLFRVMLCIAGDQKRLVDLVHDAERNLAMLKRQAALSQLYVHDRNIVESPSASVAHKPLSQMLKDGE